MDMYTLQCLKCITNKVLLYSTGNSAQYYVAAWMGVWGRMDTRILMAEPLCCVLKTITTLLISYIPIHNEKFKKLN